MERKTAVPVLEVRDLKKYFPTKRGVIRAVDGVSFSLGKGETLGLVGESGCGKSSTARTVIRLYKPDSGEVLLNGVSITSLTQKELLPHRRNIQMIFQDPYSSLNGRMTVREIIGEPLDVHGTGEKTGRKERIDYLLKRVGLDPSHANRYPHEFSGGQRQRIGIARALAVHPDLVICDEPISALDVSIQAQVVNMLEDLQEELGLAFLFIAHDLSMVRHISDRMGVMYLGRILELAESEELYNNPMHPYTQGLLAANPIPDPRAGRRERIIRGDVPSPFDIPSGCRFRTRCPRVMDICAQKEPDLSGGEHKVACFLYQ